MASKSGIRVFSRIDLEVPYNGDTLFVNDIRSGDDNDEAVQLVFPCGDEHQFSYGEARVLYDAMGVFLRAKKLI